ncbi:Mga helix-turn-helix domain [[Clostridium] sordellii]|uniref:helix-turn-helix domain-containing protein n=1 Tax=Paraclostridium sordellii TaxID=1505 RepID=UPI0005DE8927|nr:helix-turn-helix domain-containing protein [Paeniclostridium sordellii]CEQ29807.1 Mga helix-turn-helix domain [[Clostridium] sordellii] [Paeniclostridium sordellii]
MFKEDLLELSEKTEIEILKKLYINNGNFSKHNMCTELNISFPTLKHYIKNINTMFSNYYDDKINIYINKEIIFLKYDIDISLDNFVSIYIKNSLKYKLLSMFYYYKDLNSIKLSTQLNVSLSTINRKIKECNELLAPFNLKIKNFELKGSPIQFAYFYYSFFRNSGVNKQIKPTCNDKDLVKFLEKVLSFKFAYSYKLNIYIWSKIILRHRDKFNEENFSDEFSLSNLTNLKDNIIFKNLELFYSRFLINKKYLAFVTTCFLKSFGGLPFEDNIDQNTPFILSNFILANIKSLFSNNYFRFSKVFKNNILTYCNRQFYFKGVFYSIDKNFRDFYLNTHLSFLKNHFITNLFKNIQSYFNLNYFDFDCFKFLIVLNLSILNEDNKYQFIDKTNKYTLKIGVLSKTDNLVLEIKIREFNNFLKRRFNAKAEIFYEENLNSYDLIITNMHDKFLDGLTINVFRYTYLGIEYDSKNLIEALNSIEKERIKKLEM